MSSSKKEEGAKWILSRNRHTGVVRDLSFAISRKLWKKFVCAVSGFEG
jgi:hypothetical protein